jgi:hypothetical protein
MLHGSLSYHALEATMTDREFIKTGLQGGSGKSRAWTTLWHYWPLQPQSGASG